MSERANSQRFFRVKLVKQATCIESIRSEKESDINHLSHVNKTHARDKQIRDSLVKLFSSMVLNAMIVFCYYFCMKRG